jgi:hypothetical protein
MVAEFALALSLSVAPEGPSVSRGADAVQLVRDACVSTELDRDAFEALGQERRWRRVRLTPRAAPAGWNTAFRANGVLVMMLGGQEPGGPGTGSAVVCSVSVERADQELEGEFAALAESLGLGSESLSAESLPGFIPPRIWSTLGGQTLTYAAAPDGRAVISLSRQIVISETAPVSPPGN